MTGEREPVRLATTANIILRGLQVIDGAPCEVDDRVLVKDQADRRQNGIYTASEGEWFRAADARTARTLQKGTTVHTQVGTVNADRVFEFTADEPVLGSDAITIVPFVPPDIERVVEEVEALKDVTVAAADAAAGSAMTAATNAGLTAADRLETAAAVVATAANVAATGTNLASAQAARDASLYGKGIFPTIAAAIGFGVVGSGAITAGSGGTNGTFDLAFTGGAGSGAAGRFVVAGGALTQILITAPGSYTVAPSFSFAASAGLAEAAAAVVLGRNVDVGEYFWTEVSTGVLGLHSVTAGPVATDTGGRAATSDLISNVYSLAMIEGLSILTARLTEAAGSVSPSVYRPYSFVSGDMIEHVVVAKAGERSALQLIHNGAGAVYIANFNLEEGVVSSSSGANIVSTAITDLGSGWYECKAVVLVAANVTNNVQTRMSSAGVLPYTADGMSGMYIRSIVLRKQGETANLFPSSDPVAESFTKQGATVTTTTSPYEPALIPLPPLVDELDVLIRGRMTASKLVEMTGPGSPSVWQAKSVVSGDSIVWRVIAKKAERHRLNLFSNSGASVNCTFDLDLGTAIGTGASILALGNGWYECTVEAAATATSGANWQNRIFPIAGGHPYVGDGASGLYVQRSELSINGGPNVFFSSEDLSTSSWAKSAGATVVPDAALYLGLLSDPASAGGDAYDDGSAALVGKKLVALGSSITAQGQYTSVLAEQTGMVLTNLGVGGAALGASTTGYPSYGIYNAIGGVPADTEIVTLEAGINDFGAQEVTLGALNDTTTATFYGALFAAVTAIRAQAPSAKIIFMTPYSGGPGHATHKILRVNGQGNTLDQFMQAVRDVANLTGWPRIDVGGESGIGYFTSALYMSDELHINAAGGLRHGTFDVEEFRRLSRRGFFGA
ncbi:SGNH/GDSL hydrolase family protein [Mesorhizobium sp. M9A.F.Ca.ET.002.03.1.2]|uniref:SGNH/GDSL hydrolase family protein n=1 Tax=Mesorhizobium sp. M9A.F.Ca.ET.002.03.1.2 TaxID=2493668 RepID=UPI001675838A|nr:SGNH/GDSL hydrolase family protein [Mesorhizobium sp. M9A.F.Ca.ET.002.03.1.2]